MWWLWSQGASAWTPEEARSLELGPVTAMAMASVEEEAVLLIGSEQGLRLIALDSGEELARSEGPVRTIWAGDADGDGGWDVLTCGPGGLGAVGIYPSPDGLRLANKLVDDRPCEAVDAMDTLSGRALLVVADGQVRELFPSLLGPREVPHPEILPGSPPLIVGSGSLVGVVDQQGALQRLGPEPGVLAEAPVLAVVSRPPDPEPRFVALRGGERPELVLPNGAMPVPGGATGLAVGRERLWLLDTVNLRVGFPEQGRVLWFPSPVSPALALVADLDEDDCDDLVISDGVQQGAVLEGDCSPPRDTAAAPAQPRGPRIELPPVPEVLELRQDWPVLHIRAGEPVLLRVKDVETGWTRYLSRGGPPGFSVYESGEIEFTADEEDVGRWRVSVRSSADGTVVRWSGFELAIWPGDGHPSEEQEGDEEHEFEDDVDDVVADEDDPGEDGYVPPPPRKQRSYAPRRCLVGLGMAGGAASAGGSTWQNLGAANVRGGVSPMASVACGFGVEQSHFVVGLDSAPYFRYGDVPADRRHLLALTVGADAVLGATSLGAIASIGATSRGLGLRLVWAGLQDWKGDGMGLETRALWLAPKAGGELSMAWVWSF